VGGGMIKAGMMKAAYQRKLLLTFEGADAATTWPELAQGLSPDYNNYCELDTAQKYSGSASLLLPTNKAYSEVLYTVPGTNTDSFTHQFRMRWRSANGSIYLPQLYDADGTNSCPFIAISYTQNYGWYAYIFDRLENDLTAVILDIPAPTVDAWTDYKYVVNGRDITLFINDVLFNTWTATIDTPFAGLDSWWAANACTGVGMDVWVDQVEVNNQ
jgi:hypothetical protein